MQCKNKPFKVLVLWTISEHQLSGTRSWQEAPNPNLTGLVREIEEKDVFVKDKSHLIGCTNI